MAILMSILLYLGLGILSDILISGYTIFVGKELRFPASLTSTLSSFLSLVVIVKFFLVSPSLIGILAYAGGNGIGTYLLMSLSKHLKKKIK